MKTLFSLFVAAFFSVSTLVAQTDATIVANWVFPMTGWGFPNAAIPPLGIAGNPRALAKADSIGNFDAAGAVFDQVWTSLNRQGVSGAGYPIGNVTGVLASDKGAADFSGAFKVVYDDNNFYVLLKYTDDVNVGTEAVEIMWAPYLDIPAIAAIAPTIPQAPYVRYSQFGAYKATFGPLGFSAAMIVDFNAAGTGNINWGGTNDILAGNLFYDNKTASGTNVIKRIYTIGYQALTGNAYTVGNARPDFNAAMLKSLNGGKGISFDVKVADVDPDDPKNEKNEPTPAEYWWNSTHNDGYAVTYYSGFLGVNTTATALNSVYSNKPNIFADVTSTQVQLSQNANVEVYNSIGKRVVTLKNANNVDLTNLNKGVYVIRANNQSLKFVR